MTASLRAPSPAVLAVLTALLGLTLGVACRISNEDHCVHKALDSDAWCAEQVPGKPFCSPCEAVDHGCVAARPDDEDCPAYAPDSSSGESG
ncbi:MAG TPA: hypothetical protein VGB85_20280 [Nannocystis sp.]